MVERFTNEPTLELRRADAREALVAALAELDRRLPLRVPLLIGGEPGRGAGEFESTDPGTPSRVVATAASARRSSSVGSLRNGGASSSSIGAPLACALRNDSFAVFSSRRRTR